MPIEELMKRATIELQTPLTLKEAEDMLLFIAREIPANVYHHANYHRSFYRPSGGETHITQEGTAGLSSTVSSLNNPMAFDTLVSVPYEEDTSKIKSLRFQLVPGLWECDYRPEVLALWDQTRDAVKKYFSERK